MCKEQVARGKKFLHELPAHADSWSELSIQEVEALPVVEILKLDRCQFGQCDEDGRPVKKETKWMSTWFEILERSGQRCSGCGAVCSATGTPHAVCS